MSSSDNGELPRYIKLKPAGQADMTWHEAIRSATQVRDDLAAYEALSADNGGKRFNQGKRRLDLMPPDAIAATADVFTFGAQKYGERNWERGMDYSKVIASLERHTLAVKSGEDVDEESGQLHTALIAANALFLLAYQLRGIGKDDRHKVSLPPALVLAT